MASLLTMAGGRRAKFVVCVLALLVFVAAGAFAGKLEEVQKNEAASFLPGEAESLRALDQIERFPSGELAPAVVVYQRAGGLEPRDRAEIGRDRAALNRDPPPATLPSRPPELSPDGSTALLVYPIRPEGDSDVLVDATNQIRDRVRSETPGLEVAVTGPAGFSTDAIKVFQSIDGTLLLATLALVFVLLILIYRSPIFWLIPFFSVVFAEVTARALAYGLGEAGVTINGQAAGILPVLVFGAGTDYALLLVARYREELRRHDDKHVAMRIALRRAGPAILASGATVVAALLCLSLAEVNGTAGLGPIGAMGIAVAVVSMLTVLPALLTVFGRRAFWPFVPRVGAEGADETHGVWRRLGERIARRPRPVWIGTIAALLVCCIGLTQVNADLTRGNSYTNDVESVQGQEMLARAFPAGANAPSDVVVPDPARVPAVVAALREVPGVASVRPVERGDPGVRVTVTLRADPYSVGAFDSVPRLRDAAKAGGGDAVLVGGPTAQEADLRESAERDTRLIVPIALAVVFLILILLLRAVVAPLLLMGTVILSFAAALGIGAFFTTEVFGFAGEDPSFPLYVFIFLVALGVDYNIFLMARVREETQRHGTRVGTIRGLAVTGAVITSAGIVLAGTFSTLAVLPLVFLTTLGFTIAVGVLLDTLVVRSVLVPALVLDVGRRVWWPSSLARRRDGERGDEPDAPPPDGDEPAVRRAPEPVA